LFKDLTLDLALEAFVGVELGDAERTRINRAFIAAVRAGTSVVRRPHPGGVGPRSNGLAARAELEAFFRAALPAKRRSDGDDLFAQLCRARDDHGNAFSDDDIVNHMIFLLMAAHDTTTTTLTSMAYQLARSPEWQERCRAECLAVPDPRYDDGLGLTSLDLVMKESLRLCAPVPSIPRVATRETVINGFRIPTGAVVTNSPYQNHYLTSLWREPDRFDPERFTPERAEDKVHRTAFVPFGAGVHKCIGMYFAGLQVRLVLHELLTRYRWSVPSGYEMPIDLVALPVPRDGLPVTLERLP
jgi:cytochrome P450